MAEPAIALREHPQIIELFTVLEQNGLHQQKDEVQALVSYIDGMEDKLSRMVDEMTAMRKEVDRLHDRSIQARCSFLMNEAENKVHQVSSMVSTAKNNTISAAGRMVQTFHEKGRAALRHAVQTLRIPAVLTRMEHGFSHASQAMEKCRTDGCDPGGTASGGRPSEKCRTRPCRKRSATGQRPGCRQRGTCQAEGLPLVLWQGVFRDGAWCGPTG